MTPEEKTRIESNLAAKGIVKKKAVKKKAVKNKKVAEEVLEGGENA